MVRNSMRPSAARVVAYVTWALFHNGPNLPCIVRRCRAVVHFCPSAAMGSDLLTKAGLSYMEVTWKNRMLFPSMLCVSPVHEQILAVHIQRRSLPLAEDVSVASIASSTTGFTGADLANLVNEAALLAGRGSKGARTLCCRHLLASIGCWCPARGCSAQPPLLGHDLSRAAYSVHVHDQSAAPGCQRLQLPP